MALFEFDLADIEDIVPWGTAPKQSLSWFGLTDGVYHMDVHGKQLFRYSDEIRAHWKFQYSELKDTPFVDYQVVRLWEDLLEMLPDILNPIPDKLFHLIETHES